MIRQMEARDVSAVHKIEEECFSLPWSEHALHDAISNKDALFLVMEENREIIGYIGMYMVIDEADITNIAISKGRRRQGYGQQLLNHAIMCMEQREIFNITLEVRKSNAGAIALYEQNGFLTEGIRKNFYDFPKEDACIMWRRGQSL